MIVKTAILLPVRMRPTNLFRLYDSFVKNRERQTTVVFAGVDVDNKADYPSLPPGMQCIEVPLEKDGEPFKTVPKINYMARQAMLEHPEIEVIAFVGDDIVIKTPGFDVLFENVLAPHKYGMAFPNDLHQGPLLPTHPFMTSSIVKKLGCFAPECLWHTRVDAIWKNWGLHIQETGKGVYHYAADVIFDHYHPNARKGKQDLLYLRAYSREWKKHDAEAFDTYIRQGLHNDLIKLN